MPTHTFNRVHQLADADNQNPALCLLHQNSYPIKDGGFYNTTNNNDEIEGVGNAVLVEPVGVAPGVNPHGNAVDIPYDTINLYDDSNPNENPPNTIPDASIPLLPPPPLYNEPNPIVPKVEPELILVENVTKDDDNDNENTHYPLNEGISNNGNNN